MKNIDLCLEIFQSVVDMNMIMCMIGVYSKTTLDFYEWYD